MLFSSAWQRKTIYFPKCLAQDQRREPGRRTPRFCQDNPKILPKT